MGVFEEEDEEEGADGGRPLSWSTMQFLSGPECSPSCDGALRLRRAAAAAASSLSLSICLLGRPTGFLDRPGPTWRTATGFPGATRWLLTMLPPPEFSECMDVWGLAGPRLEDDDTLKEELMWLPVRILECNEEEDTVAEDNGDEGMGLDDGGGD